MAYDYIKAIKDIISSLKNEGRPDLAVLLQDAVDGASTGTELLMAAKFYLSKIENDGEISQITLKKVKNALSEIQVLVG